MFKKFLLLFAALFAAAAFAAVDVNKASEAELDGIKGIGPSLSSRILAERKKSHFQDWDDLIARVKGIGPTSAKKFSADGLTVNGSAFGAPAAATGTASSKGKDQKAPASVAQEKKEDKKNKAAAASPARASASAASQ